MINNLLDADDTDNADLKGCAIKVDKKRSALSVSSASEDDCYIRSATLNGKNFSHNFLKHEELMQGGELKLIMDCVPDKERGVKPEDAPYSYNK